MKKNEQIKELKKKLKQAGEMFAWSEAIGTEIEFTLKDVREFLQKLTKQDPTSSWNQETRDQLFAMIGRIDDLRFAKNECPCGSCKKESEVEKCGCGADCEDREAAIKDWNDSIKSWKESIRDSAV